MREAIVCAFNEEATVAQVVGVLLRSGVIGRVLVVDDGSSDRTAEVARAAGSDVLRMPKNGGKGQAMIAGVNATKSDPVAFFDADLLTLTEDHVRRLSALADLGYDMVCGLRDYGLFGNPFHAVAPLITGERFVSRAILAAIPRDCWDGYATETGMNHAATRIGARTACTILPGLTFRKKADKRGFLEGLAGEARMFARIGEVQSSLDCHGSCKVR
jgi:glycosyltransferase involved in cell wall biosynthesis